MSGCVCVRAEGEEGEEGREGEEEEEENTSDRVWTSREGGAGEEDIRWADVVVQGGGAPARRLVIH